MRFIFMALAFLTFNACKSTKAESAFAFAENPVIAHRGAWKALNLPQNSIASLKHAIELGCTGSEFDVRMTADNVLVVNHDPDYNGLFIEETTYSELSKHKLSNGEVLPTLRDYLLAGMENNPGTGLVCEIKPSKTEGRNVLMAEKVLDLVNELNAEKYISYYISFSYEFLKKIIEIDPNAKTQFLDGSKSLEILNNDGITGLDYATGVYKRNPEWIESAKKHNLKLNAWTVNKSQDIDMFLAHDFDYITTDMPELVFERMQNRIQKKPENELKVMTYNVRLDIASDEENAWPNRKDFLTSQVLFLQPDILGVQEARPNQVEDLKESLKDYEFIGKGRDGGQEGEHAGIYYNSNKLSVEKEHTFWLSETPDVVSKGWDAAYPRVCTYGLFTMKQTKQKIWVFNTHLDHIGKVAQKDGMLLILDKIKEVNTTNYPVIIMGDFNVEPDSEVIKILKTQLSDSREKAEVVFGPEGTFNAFKYDEPVIRRIDYIMVSDGINVEKYATLSSSIDLRFPSDHFPVFVTVIVE